MDVKTTRRSALKILGGGALAVPYIIRPRPAWAQSKVVNVTTYDKFLPQEFVDKFQRDTGIEVQVRLTDDQGKQYNLLAAEGGKPDHRHRHRGQPPLRPVRRFEAPRLPLDTGRHRQLEDPEPASISNRRLARASTASVWGVPILAGFEGLARNTRTGQGRRQLGASCSTRKYKGFTSYIVGDFLSVTMLYLGYDGDFVSYVGKPEEAQKATNEARDFLIKNKGMVRKYYDAGSEVQQMFINEDIYVAQTWSGPAAKLIMDGHPIELSVPKEGTYGFVLHPQHREQRAERRQRLQVPRRGARLAGSRRGDDAASGFTSTFGGVEKRPQRARAEGLGPAAGADRARRLLQLAEPRHEERDDRPRHRRDQGGLIAGRTA